MSEETQEVVDQQEEEVVETVEETPDDQEQRDAWAEAVPDIEYDELSDAARVKVLARRLTAKTSEEVSTDEAATAASSTQDQQSAPPSIPELPTIDEGFIDKARTRLASALGDDQAEAIIQEVMQPLIDHSRGIAARAVAVLDAQDKTIAGQNERLDTFNDDVVIPASMAAAVKNVPGAEASDVPVALEYLRSKDANTKEAALKMAAYDRRSVVPKAKASEESKRKAAAVNAAAAAGPSPRGGQQTGRIPRTVEEMAKLLEQEANA